MRISNRKVLHSNFIKITLDARPIVLASQLLDGSELRTVGRHLHGHCRGGPQRFQFFVSNAFGVAWAFGL